MRGSKRGGGGSHRHENHKARGFLCNTGPDTLDNHRATKSAFNYGSLLARQRADDGPLLVVFGSLNPHPSSN